MLALAVAPVVDRPHLGPLVLRIPLAEFVAEREEALLGACLFLVAAGTAHHGVEVVLLDRVEQRRGLQAIARRTRCRVFDNATAVDRLLHRRDDEVDVEPLDRGVAELEDLGKVVAGVDVHDGEGQLRGPERLLGDVQHHDAVLAAREQQDRPLEFGRDFAQAGASTLLRARRDARSGGACERQPYAWLFEAYESDQPCKPHSIFPRPAQRPDRGSSPGATGRVHGQHPIDG